MIKFLGWAAKENSKKDLRVKVIFGHYKVLLVRANKKIIKIKYLKKLMLKF